MLSEEEVIERRDAIAGSPDLQALLARLRERAARIIADTPPIPAYKALLSVDGGACPKDGQALRFDPWSPDRHQCPACGASYDGERHDRAWARFQHLWLGERIAHLATVAVLAGDDAAARTASALLEGYGERYLDYPNQDNVLGPSRLFFSTYLESIWITNVIAGALLLRGAGMLDEETTAAVEAIANEAAGIIAEFNEGMSNRQTWHNAALTALGLWFEDEELVQSAVRGSSGLLEHLVAGFGNDGMWFEGENYHLFALRGMLVGLSFARAAGLDAWQSPDLARRIAAALRVPIQTALPDLTFPARKDSRYGVSLAQPMYLELWEAGLAGDPSAGDLAAWLGALYQVNPAPPARDFDSWLHEAGLPAPQHRSRADLSWWMLLVARPDLPASGEVWGAPLTFIESQGLAIIRSAGRYVSLECGDAGGGHGHPDTLCLTLFQDGVHWLADPGSGSYVARDLFWYRSTLAHNAPMLDGMSQAGGIAACEVFGANGGWSVMRGRLGDLRRTVVVGPDSVLDVLQLAAYEPHLVELPWHLAGDWSIEGGGQWEPAELEGDFVSSVERWVPASPGPLVIRAQDGDASLVLAMTGAAEWLRAEGPGRPGAPRRKFLLARARGAMVRIATAITREKAAGIEVKGDAITVTVNGEGTLHHADEAGWVVEGPGGQVSIRGPRVTRPAVPRAQWESAAHARAVQVEGDTIHDLPELAEPLELDREDQYRRSEEPWAEDGSFSARAWVGWNEMGLEFVVEVTKPDLYFRGADAPALMLDNEPDDIHSDGLELFIRPVAEGPTWGCLVIPSDDGALRVREAGGGPAPEGMATGHWEQTDDGYRVRMRVAPPGWEQVSPGDAIGFDLIINEMRPGRMRRAGQLVWGGDGGWVYLRGDRHDPSALGTLKLA